MKKYGYLSRLLKTIPLMVCVVALIVMPASAASKGYAAFRELNLQDYHESAGDLFGHAGIVEAVDSSGTPTWIIHTPGSNAYPYTVTSVTLRTFQVPDSGLSYYGTYWLPGYSSSKYNAAYDVAVDLDILNPPYVFVRQLTHSHSGSTGQIAASEITAIRCDGVVEYAYEVNDMELLGRTVSGLYYWDISDPLDYVYHNVPNFNPEAQRAAMTPRS